MTERHAGFSNSGMSYVVNAGKNGCPLENGAALSTLEFESEEDDHEPVIVDPAAETLPELPELPETD